MDREEIDRLIEAIEDEDYYTILKMAEIDIPEGEAQEYFGDDENLPNILKRLAIKIDHGDFDYLLAKAKDGEDGPLELLPYSENTAKIKEVADDIFADDSENLQFKSYIIGPIMLATKDKK